MMMIILIKSKGTLKYVKEIENVKGVKHNNIIQSDYIERLKQNFERVQLPHLCPEADCLSVYGAHCFSGLMAPSLVRLSRGGGLQIGWYYQAKANYFLAARPLLCGSVSRTTLSTVKEFNFIPSSQVVRPIGWGMGHIN